MRVLMFSGVYSGNEGKRGRMCWRVCWVKHPVQMPMKAKWQALERSMLKWLTSESGVTEGAMLKCSEKPAAVKQDEGAVMERAMWST